MRKQPIAKKRTKHRIAASNPEVKELIQKFRRLWKRRRETSPITIRQALRELVDERGCTLRGLAAEMRPEGKASTLRYYYNLQPDVTKEKPEEKVETPSVSPVAVNGVRTGPPKVKAGTFKEVKQQSVPQPTAAQAKSVSASTPPKLTSSAKQEPSAPVERREETKESLRQRLDEVLVDFIRAKLKERGKPADEEMFGTARTMTVIGRQGAILRALPSQMSEQSLCDRTKPKFAEPEDQAAKSRYLGAWAAGILNSLCPEDQNRREQAVEEARQQILFAKNPPPRTARQYATPEPKKQAEDAESQPLASPKPQIPTVDEFGRPLKPYEISLKLWARKQLANKPRSISDITNRGR